MFTKFRTIPMAVAAAALLAAVPVSEGSVFSTAAFAQEAAKSQQKTRKVPAMSLGVHKKVQKAQEAMDLSNLAEAKEILADTLTSKGINDYERAVVWQLNAMIAFEEENTKETIRAYEQILQYRESIPEALELNIVYGLGQLYFSEENFDKALEYITQWENQVDPTLIGVSQLSFIATLHYQRQTYDQTLEYIYKAIEQAEGLDTVEVKENWYQLALSAHWEMNQYAKVRDVLEVLIIRWPNPTYWTQLAGIYGELGEEQTSFSVSEAAYLQGFLDDKPLQVINVAQIQLARNAPIKCAWIMERAFREELIEDNAKNRKTLGQCYLAATEYRKALAPLQVAAREDDDGDLWLQIGQVQMQLDQYNNAVESFKNVNDSFKDDTSESARNKKLSATMMTGQALTELKKFDDAKAAFTRASRLANDSRERSAVANWRRYLSGEEQREQLLTGR